MPGSPQTTPSPLARAEAFCAAYGLRLPVLMAPMAGACPPSLAAAVANAGGMGACGARLMDAEAIDTWTSEYRAASNGALMLNTWIPDPAPVRDHAHEAAVRAFLGDWGPTLPEDAGDSAAPDFAAQCDGMLAAGAPVMSSIMGLFPDDVVAKMKAQGVKWFATVSEALQAEAAGADVIVAQGAEAGGHRGAFVADAAERAMVGLFSLVPAVVDAVQVPVVAAGGVADGRGAAAALLLGASAVQVGTALLRAPEARTPPAWADAISVTRPEEAMPTRAFSGRLGRAIGSRYVRAAANPDAPAPAPFPVQRALTSAMRADAAHAGDIERMQAWAGQSARLARAAPAGKIVTALWEDARSLLGSQTGATP